MAKKSVTKRIKLTKTGKLIRRKMALDHFRAKKSGKQMRRKYEPRFLTGANKKVFLPYLTSKI